MRVVAQTERPVAENFALAAGLLRAHVIEGVPLERLAADYGYSVPRLRASLTAHLATCTAALGVEPPPAASPEATPELLQVRIRERVRIPRPT